MEGQAEKKLQPARNTCIAEVNYTVVFNEEGTVHV